jgi:hypothetical protein
VHILSGDLIMHKRTLEPVKAMLYGLRLYDTDRYIALADNAGVSAEPEAGQAGQRNIGAREAGEKVPGKVQGYLSYKAKVYLVRFRLPSTCIGLLLICVGVRQMYMTT